MDALCVRMALQDSLAILLQKSGLPTAQRVWPRSMAFESPRLLIRAWQETDRVPFSEMNADPQVMRYFQSALTLEQTDAFLERIRRHFERHGFGLWAVELKETNEFAGFIGLSVPSLEAHFTPCVEIGWRLAARFWNQGLATEGASRILAFAHDTLGVEEVVSFTAAENFASRRVMEKIGMVRDLDGDFDHPRIPKEHPLCRQVLYRSRKVHTLQHRSRSDDSTPS